MSLNTKSIFISYSHIDATIVDPIVKLLSINNAFVFKDKNSIQLGKKWKNEIENGLNEANLVLVFWSKHSSSSTEVKDEWIEAINKEKDIMPLLLDDTPLPKELAEYQGINFQELTNKSNRLKSLINYFKKYRRKNEYWTYPLILIILNIPIASYLFINKNSDLIAILLICISIIIFSLVYLIILRLFKPIKTMSYKGQTDMHKYYKRNKDLIARKIESELIRRLNMSKYNYL